MYKRRVAELEAEAKSEEISLCVNRLRQCAEHGAKTDEELSSNPHGKALQEALNQKVGKVRARARHRRARSGAARLGLWQRRPPTCVCRGGIGALACGRCGQPG